MSATQPRPSRRAKRNPPANIPDALRSGELQMRRKISLGILAFVVLLAIGGEIFFNSAYWDHLTNPQEIQLASENPKPIEAQSQNANVASGGAQDRQSHAVTAEVQVPVNQPNENLASQHTPEQIDAIKRFSFQGVSLGDNYTQVKTAFPDIAFVPEMSDAQALRAVWEHDGGNNDFTAIFSLYNGKLYDITISYPNEMLVNMGGYQAVYNKLVNNYGMEDKDTTKSAGLDNYKTPDKICEWTMRAGGSPGDATVINFSSGFGPLSYDKSTYYSGYKATLSVCDLDTFTKQWASEEDFRRQLQTKANVGF